MIRLVVALMLALLASHAAADVLRPSYLSLREIGAEKYAVLWKVPAAGDKRLALELRLPRSCKTQGEPFSGFDAGAYFERSTIACAGGLSGREVAVEGLQASATEVIARIEYRDGATQVARLTPDKPSLAVSGPQSASAVARTYLLLGMEHILTSPDHLLFVLALIFLISSRWMLVKTVTAFTLAHSLTLASATLGFFSLPQAPVEATIALSIVFLARELVDRPGEGARLAQAYPWVIAFAFGLLHGLGFAGALKEVGLPQADAPLALLAFNLGVEAGQLVFVAGTLIVLRAGKALVAHPASTVRLAAGYLIGITASFWTLDRIAAFWG